MHHSFVFSTAGNSCGVVLINGLISMPSYRNKSVFPDPGEQWMGALAYALEISNYRNYNQFMWTHNQASSVGDEMAAYIEKHGLGKVVVTDATPNPNHPTPGHVIKVWAFSRNREAWDTHFTHLRRGWEIERQKAALEAAKKNLQQYDAKVERDRATYVARVERVAVALEKLEEKVKQEAA